MKLLVDHDIEGYAVHNRLVPFSLLAGLTRVGIAAFSPPFQGEVARKRRGGCWGGFTARPQAPETLRFRSAYSGLLRLIRHVPILSIVPNAGSHSPRPNRILSHSVKSACGLRSSAMPLLDVPT